MTSASISRRVTMNWTDCETPFGNGRPGPRRRFGCSLGCTVAEAVTGILRLYRRLLDATYTRHNIRSMYKHGTKCTTSRYDIRRHYHFKWPNPATKIKKRASSVGVSKAEKRDTKRDSVADMSRKV